MYYENSSALARKYAQSHGMQIGSPRAFAVRQTDRPNDKLNQNFTMAMAGWIKAALDR
jgi:hypothetical protein